MTGDPACRRRMLRPTLTALLVLAGCSDAPSRVATPSPTIATTEVTTARADESTSTATTAPPITSTAATSTAPTATSTTTTTTTTIPAATTTSSPAARVPLCSELEPIAATVVGDPTFLTNADPVLLALFGEYELAHQDTFGGSWFDRDHGVLVLGFTDADTVDHRGAIEALRPSGDEVDWAGPPPSYDTRSVGERGTVFEIVDVARSQGELRDIQDSISDAVAATLDGWSGTGTQPNIGRAVVYDQYVSVEELEALAAQVPVDAVCIEGTIGDRPTFPETEPVDLIPAPGDDPLVTCGSATFHASTWAAATALWEVEDEEMVAGFADVLATLPGITGSPVPAAEWWLVDDDGSIVTFAGRVESGHVETVRVRRAVVGWLWEPGVAPGTLPSRGPGCTVALPTGLGHVRWELDPAYPQPQRQDTDIHLLVTETACASGRSSADRLRGPDVVESDSVVLIAFGVVPIEGGADCPGNPPTPITLELTTPLGDRELRDGLDVGDPLP